MEGPIKSGRVRAELGSTRQSLIPLSYSKVMQVTRIGIATADGVSVCDHLARSAAFVVVEVNSGVPGARVTRARGTEACGNHATFVEMLAGCDAVITGGIGEGAAVSLAT